LSMEESEFVAQNAEFVNPSTAAIANQETEEKIEEAQQVNNSMETLDDIMANLFKMSIFGSASDDETSKISPMFALGGLLGNQANNEITSSESAEEPSAVGYDYYGLGGDETLSEENDDWTYDDEILTASPSNEQSSTNFQEQEEEVELPEEVDQEEESYQIKPLTAFFSNLEIPGAPLEIAEKTVEAEVKEDINAVLVDVTEPEPDLEMEEVSEEQVMQSCPATCTCSCPSQSTASTSTTSTTTTTTTTPFEPSTDPSFAISEDRNMYTWHELSSNDPENEQEEPEKELNLNLTLYPCARTSAYQLNLALRLCRRADEE
jgi:hypothetical protein